MIAALYVQTGGVYYGLDDVDPWDEARDARLYTGPWAVVAHPPCARWSRLAGFTEARFGLKRGEDGGCFAAALESVRRFGGVIEHPAYSAAWRAFDLPIPQWHGGWTADLWSDGHSAYVEQGRYGLPVKKATWLYAVGVELAELKWGYTPDGEGHEPNGVFGGMDNWRDRWGRPSEFMRGNRHNGLRSRTPEPFRDVLLAMARTASPAVLSQGSPRRANERASASERYRGRALHGSERSAPARYDVDVRLSEGPRREPLLAGRFRPSPRAHEARRLDVSRCRMSESVAP